jgi:hypothetical protein
LRVAIKKWFMSSHYRAPVRKPAGAVTRHLRFVSDPDPISVQNVIRKIPSVNITGK